MRTSSWLAIIGAFALAGTVVWGARSWFDEVVSRRRLLRRIALERRMRARSRCSACGAIGKAEFRTRAGALLRELGESEPGRVAGALVEYGTRAAHDHLERAGS